MVQCSCLYWQLILSESRFHPIVEVFVGKFVISVVPITGSIDCRWWYSVVIAVFVVALYI